MYVFVIIFIAIFIGKKLNKLEALYFLEFSVFRFKQFNLDFNCLSV